MYDLLKGNKNTTEEYGPIFKNRNLKIIAAIVLHKWHSMTCKEPILVTDFAQLCDIPKKSLNV